MGLIFKPEPKEVADAVNAGLDRMHTLKAFSTPLLAQRISQTRKLAIAPSAPLPTQALPVYTLGLNDLADGKGFTAAIQTGWRYLVRHDNEIVASADAIVGHGREPQFAQVSEGPLVAGLDSALQAANLDKSLEKGEYEVRLLIAPALYVVALWFVDKAKGQDLAMPINPAREPLVPNKLMKESELLAVLHEAAIIVRAAQPPDRK